MEEKQILLVKISWSALYKTPEYVEKSLARQFNKIYPLSIRLDNSMFKGLSTLINNLVLNLHTFQNIYQLLDSHVKAFGRNGYDREAFNYMVQAFLLTIEKIHGKAWNIELKRAWVITIASVSSKYSEWTEEMPPEVTLN